MQGAVGAVQTAVAKSGKGAAQGAVGAVQTAVAKSGKGAAQDAVGAVQTAVRSLAKVLPRMLWVLFRLRCEV